MIHRILAFATSVLITLPALAQVQFPPSKELQRPASEELLRDERPSRIGGARSRVVRASCEQHNKDAPRPLAIAYVVGYETSSGAEVTFSLADVGGLDVRTLHGRPQSLEDERDEARAVTVGDENVIKGGFVVDPPSGSPPGRYSTLLICLRARHVVTEEAIVNLTRQSITPRRTTAVPR